MSIIPSHASTLALRAALSELSAADVAYTAVGDRQAKERADLSARQDREFAAARAAHSAALAKFNAAFETFKATNPS